MKIKFCNLLTLFSALLCISCSSHNNVSNNTDSVTYQSDLSLEQLKSTLNGNIITYALDTNIQEYINPISNQNGSEKFILDLMYLPLLKKDNADYEMVLAESIKQHNNFTYEIKLKSNVFWSDGTALNADDVVFTYQLMQKEPYGWAYLHLNYPEGKVQIQQLDETTILFTFPFPHANGMAMLSDILILPEHIFNFYDKNYTIDNSVFWRKPVCSGPFIINDYAPDKYLLFKTNHYFYDSFSESSKIDYLIININNNSRQNTSIISEKKADITVIPSWDIRILNKKVNPDSEQKEIKRKSFKTNQLRYLGINGKKVRNRKLREAIFYSLDRTLINESGFIDPQYYSSEFSFIPQTNKYFCSDMNSLYFRDSEKVQNLLKNIDEDPFTLTLSYCSNDDSMLAQATIIKDLLVLSNINVSLKAVDNKRDLYKYDLFLDDMSCENEPDLYSKYFLYESKQNNIHYYNPQIDLLFKQGRYAENEETRIKIYNEIQNIISESAYFYPLCTYSSVLVYNSDVLDP